MGQAESHPYPIVGVGASAGGLTPLKELVSALPAEPGLALVIVQHLDPHAESYLGRLLQPHTSMEVVSAVHGTPVAPNQIYVIQPNTNVAITDGILTVTPRPDDRRPYYPVDHFFRSLAMVQGPHAVGVVLSGTGSDGTLGVCEIKAAGGVTFAQDETAQHTGMPHSAIESGAVDLVLPPSGIGSRIADLPRHPFLSGERPPERIVEDGDDFHRVIAALRRMSGVDFSQYRDTTIKRRTARRMLLRGVSSPKDYVQTLETDRQEAEALYRDVLINVTSFFRDPEMFEILKQRVIPDILKTLPEGQPIRVWVPGCSTGQEAYSLAMVLTESLSGSSPKAAIQVFATDVGDTATLDQARAGVYPEGIEAEVSPERLHRFFVKEGRRYRIQKFLRDCCVFARQNITIDPPFSRVDLVSCRNVMIYMSPALQERLLPIFHFALNRHGFLVLGLAESIGHHGDLFAPIDRHHKIFRRKEATRRPALTFMTGDWLADSQGHPRKTRAAEASDFVREADRLTLEVYGPPSVLVNEEFEIQQFRGRTAAFLESPAGRPTTNLLRMIRKSLLMEVRSALSEAKATRRPVTRTGLRVPDGNKDLEFALRIVPVTSASPEDLRLLVIFEAAGGNLPSVATTPADSDVNYLQQELASTKLYLESIVDEQDSSGQELRAAHEEVLSSNEELQSTNEELQTTKEELQSANEELTTVNEQFYVRNLELGALTDEMTNFIGSADLPMVTVGRDLTIRRLTPAAQRAFNLLPSDVGRSIEHIKFSLDVDGIEKIVDAVITSMQPWDQEVRDRSGQWWLLRARPFVTADNRVDGATLVAVDIDQARRSREFQEARDLALAVVRTVREPLVVLNRDGRVGLANDAYYRLFGESASTLKNQFLWETSRGVWSEPMLRLDLEAACRGHRNIENREIRRTLPSGGERILVLNAHAIRREERPTLLLLAVEDVTEARQAEALRIDAETLRLINRRKDEFLGILAHELRNPLAPMRFALEILHQSAGDPDATNRARQVLGRQVSHMVRIVDDLLDVSRITQGKVELRKEPVQLDAVVSAAVEFVRPAIDAARHTLTVSLPDEPVVINADSVRLTQVLVNLLNNAIKFTPQVGHIWLIAEHTGEGLNQGDVLRIRVRDTGIGIAADMRHRIFDMFTQGDRSLERARTGLGVGLTLVRNLVEMHGGSIEVRSDGIGQGSEFVVTLPAVSVGPRQAPDTHVTKRPQRHLRILVADDDDDARELVAFLFRKEGHVVEAAADGRQALEIALAFHPDVGIFDVGMPGMNGLDLAKRLRQTEGGRDMLLIAMSGLGQLEDKARAMEAGFDHHLTKPVEFGGLLAVVEQERQRPAGR